MQNIDLESQISIILGSNQNINDFEVTFYESMNDANSGSNQLTFPYSNSTANTQTIYVRIVNRNTGCFVFANSFDIIINSLPEFEVSTPQFICLNRDNLELGVENPADTYDY